MKYFWALLFILITPIIVLSQNSLVDNTEKNYSYAPGTTSSIPFILLNEGDKNTWYEISITIDNAKIQLYNTQQTINITAHQKSIVIIPLKIDKDCPAGQYNLSIRVLNKNDMNYKVYSIKILINKHEKLTISPVKATDILSAGDTIYSTFIIKNLGNTERQINISSKSGKINYDSKIQLSPLEEKKITVSKPSNPRESRILYELIDLSITDTTSKEDKLTAYSSIDILPTNPLQLDSYKRLPIRTSLIYIHSDQHGNKKNGWQGEIYSMGSFSNNTTEIFELHAVTKNPIPYNSYTTYEEYFARYNNEKFNIHIGDKPYSSSVLTENFRYGRGIEMQYNFEKISIGGFYNRPRFYTSIKDEFNLRTDIKINKTNSITVGYLQKRPLKDSSTYNSYQIKSIAHLPYLIYKSKTVKNTTLETEFSTSNTIEKNGYGFRFQGSTIFNRLRAGLNFMYSSPNYAGYYQNTTNINTSLNYILSIKTSMMVNLYQDARNLQRDTLLLAAPLRKSATLGVSHRYSSKGTINMLGGYMFNEDRMLPNLFKYNELFFQLNINHNIGLFRFDLNSQYGHTTNQIANTEGQSNFHQINVNYLYKKLAFTAFGSMSKTSRYSETSKKYFYYGGRISQQLFNTNTINLFYQSSYMPEEYYKDRNQFEGSIIHKTKSNNQIEINGRYMLQSGTLGNKDFIFSIKYIANINLPIKRIAHYSTLSGSITDINNNGLSGIRIQLADQITLSDKNGYYNFKNLIPGKYYLNIDKSTLPLDAISDINLPDAIEIGKDNLNTRNIRIIQAGTLNGRVLLANTMKYQNILVDNEKIKQSNLIIELSDGNQTLRKICRINEKFDFKYLRPGRWFVKINNNELENNVRIVNNEFQFDIIAGETITYNINLEYIQKEIQFQQKSLKVGKISN